jgi:hypothetical protein
MYNEHSNQDSKILWACSFKKNYAALRAHICLSPVGMFVVDAKTMHTHVLSAGF